MFGSRGISAYMAMSFPRVRRILLHKWLWSFSNIAVESAGTVNHDPVRILFSNWSDAQHFTDTVGRIGVILGLVQEG